MDARLVDLDPLDLKAVLAPFGQERTLPAAVYTSESVFAWEQEQVWESGWVCIGRVSDFEAGTATEVSLGSESLIVANDGGALGVFHNVCRHRGHEILAVGEQREANSLLCPYHGWLYRFDGSLRAAPKTSHRDDLEGVSLITIRTEVWHGWVMVAVDSEAPTLDEYLGDLGDHIAPYAPESLSVGHRQSYELAANWKLLHENYHECYHCSSIHPQLVAVSNPESGSNLSPTGAWVGGTLELREGVQTMSMDGSSPGHTIAGLDETKLREALYVGVIPNLFISPHPDYVLTHRLEVHGPAHTTVHCEWLFPSEFVQSESFDPSFAVDFWDATNLQDFAACESLQRGANSRGYRPGVLGEAEDAVYQFLSTMARAYLGEGLRPTSNPLEP